MDGARPVDLVTVLQNLHTQVATLQGQVQALRVAPAAAPAQRAPLIPSPERSRGERGALRGFVSECRLMFATCAADFPTPRSQVCFMVSLLVVGPALSWVTLNLEADHPLLGNLDNFIAALEGMFGEPNRAQAAEMALQNLQQGARPVTEYTSEFRRGAANTLWNEAACRFHFHQGLHPRIKDELLRVPPPPSPDGLYHVC
ncbi:Hypothetical predicted protein [Podarcis lilfordi]|uniref:Retrotransposon gag domain-containing protein n=1 Tax=Podarcis lilfordi TaxID=74358 RepID=A0AA35PUF5_9SAUR|nr:Hypothetical predicted protein [Podarcis lilfordi]